MQMYNISKHLKEHTYVHIFPIILWTILLNKGSNKEGLPLTCRMVQYACSFGFLCPLTVPKLDICIYIMEYNPIKLFIYYSIDMFLSSTILKNLNFWLNVPIEAMYKI